MQQFGGDAMIPETLKEWGYDLDPEHTALLCDFLNKYSLCHACGIDISHWIGYDPIFPAKYAIPNPATKWTDMFTQWAEGLSNLVSKNSPEIIMDSAQGNPLAMKELHKIVTSLKTLSAIKAYPGGVPLNMGLDAAEIGIDAIGGRYHMTWKDPGTGKPIGSEFRSMSDDKVSVFDALHHALHLTESERLRKLNQAHWEQKKVANPSLPMEDRGNIIQAWQINGQVQLAVQASKGFGTLARVSLARESPVSDQRKCQ